MENTTQEIHDKSPMPFGKHRGKAMANVPAAYLIWLLDAGCSGHEGVRKYILDNLQELKHEVKRTNVRY